jgi:hypothetical protein
MSDADTTRSLGHRITGPIVIVAMIVGFALRIEGVSEHSMGHAEIYIPGISLPEGLAKPEPRFTVVRTITSTITVETHPPGYYLFMLGWTKCFGTSLFALRIPSILFGTASVWVIFVLGSRVGLRIPGAVGGTLWATSGLAVNLGQRARIYPFACFLGLLATLLLVRSYQTTGRRRRFVLVAYVAVTLVGLATSYFMWPILAVHALYALLGPMPSGRSVGDQTRWQLFVVTLASPLLATAALQSGRESYLPSDAVTQVTQFFGLFYCWPSIGGSSIAAAVGCGLFLVAGFRSRRETPQPVVVEGDSLPCPRGLLYAAGGLALVAIEIFAYVTHRMDLPWLADRTVAIIACGAIPILVIALDHALSRGRFNVAAFVRRFGAPWPPAGLIGLLAIVPVAALLTVTPLVRLIAPQTVSLYAPYLMMLVVAGVVALFRTPVFRAVLISALITLNVAGFVEWRRQPYGAIDYGALAEQVLQETKASDLWFVFRDLSTTPIFYYLDHEQHTFIWRDYATAIRQHPDARVWVLEFDDRPAPSKVTAPLAGYDHLKYYSARGVRADLFVP